MRKNKFSTENKMTLEELWSQRKLFEKEDFPRGNAVCNIMHKYEGSCNICPLWKKHRYTNNHCICINHVFESKEDVEKFLLKLNPNLLLEEEDV